MSFLSTVLSSVGLGGATGATGSGGYTFNQQEKDFIKLQFLYGLRLKNRLADGTISQEYYDSHIWLTTQQLTPPYSAWWTEFRTAIESEDLQWLSRQVGETVASLTTYMGDALGHIVGGAVGGAISGASTGLITGFTTSLNFWGWATVAGLGFAVYYGWKKGLIQKAFKTTAKISL